MHDEFRASVAKITDVLKYAENEMRVRNHTHTANESPLRGKFVVKIRNFDSFGGCIPTFLPR